MANTIMDPRDIADRFCKYFTNIRPNLTSAIPVVNSATSHSFLGGKYYPPIILQPTHTLMNLKLSIACFRREMCVIKHSFHLISAPLANIINLSRFKNKNR